MYTVPEDVVLSCVCLELEDLVLVARECYVEVGDGVWSLEDSEH